MRTYIRVIWFVLTVVVLSACNTLKFVPEDKMLLDKAYVRVEDTKKVGSDDLRRYLQQRQNSEIFGFWKLQLHVYDLAGKDSTKWINKTLKKMGQAPEVFDEEAADMSVQYLTRAMQNKGYFDASVDTTMAVKKRKLKLTYHVTAREPYVLKEYEVMSDQPDLLKVATSKESLVEEGMLFDANVLDDERARIAKKMQQNGYYLFSKEVLQYTADSALGDHDVTCEMHLSEDAEAVEERVFQQFRINRVLFFTDFEPSHMPEDETVSTIEDGAYSFSHVGKHPLVRPRILKRACEIRPGEKYNVDNVERTYGGLNALGPVKYVDLSFRAASDSTLDCYIILSRGKLNSISANIEGTYSGGDWGVAGGVGYTNRNIFRGAEEFHLGADVLYEWRQGGGRGLEAKAEASLAFVKAPKITFSYQYQTRPREYTRTNIHGGLTYDYQGFNSPLIHHFNLLDANYVYVPWISDEFMEMYLNGTLLSQTFIDHFILGWGYSGSYTSFRKNQPYRSYVTLNYGVETAGNLLYGICKAAKMEEDPDGGYALGKIRFSQYAKGDLAFTFHGIINERHRMVFHTAFGLAYPYGNSLTVPFEKRYYAGGANSLRGWQAHALGPGAYHGSGSRIDYEYQVGDIKMEANLEYRWKVWSIFELAAFMDAGNIWTIGDYDWQEHGQISRDFYKEIAWDYGIGVRLDFSFFIFRVDFGVKLYDPGRLYYDGKPWRTAANGLCWKDDMTFNFAIGHPF